ncbi:MAG: hypothetical protein ACK5JH_05940 [Anaerocolumna sp.]
MKKIKKITALILIAVMIMGGLSACGKNSKEDNPTNGDTATTTTPDNTGDTQETNPYEKTLKFTMSTVDAEKAGLTEAGEPAENFKWLCEKFNVEFEFWPLTWSNYVDQTRMWLNSDSAPDLMMLDVAPTRYSEYLAWVDAGLFREYPDLANYPNMNHRYEKMTTGKMFSVDGKLYAWPAYMDSDQYNYSIATGYTYRKDWAQAVGLFQEDETYTWDEWQTLVKTVIEKDPGNNGAGKTIGIMSKENWAFPKYVAGSISPYMLTFKQGTDGSWVWGPTLPESLEVVKTTKEMYDNGLIWSDQPMVTDNDFANNFNSGKLFAATISNSTVIGLNEIVGSWEDANPDLKPEDCISLAAVEGQDGKLLTWQNADQWSQTAMNHNISDEKAKRWTDMVEFLVSEDGYNFRNFGIQDVDWKYAADGSVECLWPTDADGNQVNPYAYGTWPWARTVGCTDGFELVNPAFPEWMRNLVTRQKDKYADASTTLIPLVAEFSFFTNETYDTAVAGLEAEIYTKVAELMTSSDIEADWTKWVTQKSAEVQPAIDELNANLK